MSRLSTEESKKIATLYVKIIEEEMDTGGILGVSGNVTDLGNPNQDDYAPGDNRVPFILGTVKTRNGEIKRSCKKCKNKNKCTCRKTKPK